MGSFFHLISFLGYEGDAMSFGSDTWCAVNEDGTILQMNRW